VGLNAFVIASSMVSRLDSFLAIIGLACGRPRFIENKKMGVNISVGILSRLASFLDLIFFSDRRFADLSDSTEIGVWSLDTSEIDTFGWRPRVRDRF
jgi:hypothetical protein